MKTAYMSSNMDFELFHWSWPGNHQPLHAMIIILNFLIDFPQAEMANECRRAVDFVLALHEESYGLVPGHQRPSATRAVAREASEAWKLFFRLRQRAWEAANLDHRQLWTRAEAASICLEEMKNRVTNESVLERFRADDPAFGQAEEEISVSNIGGDFQQAQIDALALAGKIQIF